MRPGLLAVLLLVVVAGCGARADGAGGERPADPLRGRTFVATELVEAGGPKAPVPGTEVSVEFTDDGRLIARAGCNMMQGAVDTADGVLTVAGLSMTEMGCDPPRHAQDDFVAGVLGATPRWALDGDRLMITAGEAGLTLAPREAVEPDKALVGTTWVLDTLVDGAGPDGSASSVPAGVPEVTVVFDAQRVAALGTCNGMGGEYTATGDRLTVGLLTSTDMSCGAVADGLELAVREALHGEVAFEITADRLTLTNTSGQGLQLHAK